MNKFNLLLLIFLLHSCSERVDIDDHQFIEQWKIETQNTGHICGQDIDGRCLTHRPKILPFIVDSLFIGKGVTYVDIIEYSNSPYDYCALIISNSIVEWVAKTSAQIPNSVAIENVILSEMHCYECPVILDKIAKGDCIYEELKYEHDDIYFYSYARIQRNSDTLEFSEMFVPLLE